MKETEGVECVIWFRGDFQIKEFGLTNMKTCGTFTLVISDKKLFVLFSLEVFPYLFERSHKHVRCFFSDWWLLMVLEIPRLILLEM